MSGTEREFVHEFNGARVMVRAAFTNEACETEVMEAFWLNKTDPNDDHPELTETELERLNEDLAAKGVFDKHWQTVQALRTDAAMDERKERWI